jgi:hypothetical protein
MKFTTAIAAVVVAVFARTVTAAPAPQGFVTVTVAGIPFAVPTSSTTSVDGSITFGDLTTPSQGGDFTDF